MKFTSAHLYGNVYMQVSVARTLAIRPIWGFWGSKVHKNLWLPAPWTAKQNVTPLALSSAEKSLTAQTHTQNKQ